MELSKVATNGAATALVMLKNVRPRIDPLVLPQCDSSAPNLPSPSSSLDKTDNHDTYGFLPNMPDLQREEERLKTFDQWPVTFITPEQLARNGFYYLGRGDQVCCAFCKVEIMRWVQGDDPAADHRRWAPQCPFVRKQACGTAGSEPTAVGRDECGASGTTQPPRMAGPVHSRYATEAARLATFKDWPRCMRQKPDELAEAGFFYTGQGDKTKCFYCDGGLKDWESDDVPWEQHARWFDRCAYVQLVKGRDYIQRVKSEATAIPASEEEQTIGSNQHSNQNDIPEEGGKSLDDSKICKICYSEERNVCFVPCGHVVACAKCALSTNKCPMCRRTFTNAVRLYFS